MTVSPPGVATRYLLDRTASRFTVQAFSGGLFSALGHNPTFAIRDFDGEAIFDPSAPDRASVTVHIRAASLELIDNVSAKDHREIETTMHEKVLESARYPEIVYQSEAEGVADHAVALSGKLSLHGVTNDLRVIAQLSMTGDLLRASGECALLQSDYGIKRVNVAGGALKVKDELKFAFDIVARKE